MAASVRIVGARRAGTVILLARTHARTLDQDDEMRFDEICSSNGAAWERSSPETALTQKTYSAY